MKALNRMLGTAGLILLISISTTVDASHIIGGNLGYTYVGETAPGSQVYRYNVYMEFFLNCGNESNWNNFNTLLAQNGGNFPVGVYTQDPTLPNANKVRFTTLALQLESSSDIIPDLPGGCTVGSGLCTKLGVLTAVLDVPLNFGGYHLYFQMNARNSSINNLFDPGMTGIGFYAFIPPPLLVNSSPIWLGIPTPLLCVSDTSTFINSATDPDGDQLIFSFEVPYSSVNGGGGVIQPPLTLPNNVPLVTYLIGFNEDQPFGSGGYAFINGATGLTRYVPPLQGNYVIAVEVKEYRNGNLIGRTRRDLQLQAIVCPPNDAPQPLGAQPTSYTVQAGEQLCFDLGFQDPNADSLGLVASGTIFNGDLFNPPATIIAPISGAGTVASTFCWNTECEQGQDQPYLFSASVSDNGCPPRTLDVIYQVNVVPFIGPTSITGPAQVCAGQTSNAYSTTSISGAIFAWTVAGGMITSGQGSNMISVSWGVSGAGSVQVSATNTLGCTSVPVDIPVTIVPLPNASAGNDVTICPGLGTTLGDEPTGPPGSSSTWTPATGLTSTSAANPFASPTVTTDYIVQVTNGGCSNRDTVRVTVSQVQVEAGNDLSFCAGGNAQLGATGTGAVSWSPPTGLSAADILDPVANPVATTLYTITLTNSAGCTASDSLIVTVNPLPVAAAGPDISPCDGTDVTLGGSPTGPPGSTFVWSPPTNLDDPTAGNPILAVTTDEVYVVMVTDMNQCVSSDPVIITILPLPDVDAGPDFEVCAGESIQLQGSGTGDLLWTPAFGLSDPTIADPICFPEITTTYVLTVTGTNTCTNSDQTTVVVNVLPSANAGIDRTICAGDSVQLGTISPGNFVWTPATGLSDPNVATPTASPSTTTTYVVTLTDPMTCNAQDTVVVNVLPISVGGDDGNLSLCSSGQIADLFAQLGGTPDPGGQWSAPNGSTHGGSLDPAIDEQGTYMYIAGAGTICADTATVQVIITTPAVQISGDDTICFGESTQITASGGTQYSWSPTDGVSDPTIADPIITTSATTDYTVSITDAGGCTATGQITITVNALPLADAGLDQAICDGNNIAIGGTPTGPPGSTFLWTPSVGLNDPSMADPTAQPTSTTTYTVEVIDANQCTAMDSVIIVVNALPTVDAGTDVSICSTFSVILDATGSGSFLWSPATGLSSTTVNNPEASPSSTTTYIVTLTDANNCSASDDVNVTVHELPTVDAGTDTWLCLGSSVMLNAVGVGTFEWNPAGSLDDPTSGTPMATPAASTTYTVMLTDANNCNATDAVLVTVGVDPPIDAGIGSTICSGTPVTLGGSPTSVPGSSFLWSPAGDLDDPASANPIATPISTTAYTLVVFNDTCTSSAVVTITIGSTSMAGFTSRFEAGCEGLRGFFTDTSVGAITWSWDLGIGVVSTERNPQFQLAYGVATTVTLTITDASGCSSSTSQTFTTDTYGEMVDLEVPNVFSPNGDGNNDVFTLASNAILGPCTNMQIMDRWGHTMFESLGNNITWDGRTFSGEPASAGTYFYMIQVKDMEFNGSLTLVR